MRDSTKVVIGLGSIWGLLSFGFLVVSSFTIGNNDTMVEIIALGFYGFTVLPMCILAIWYRRFSAIWLIALSLLSSVAFVYQGFHQSMDQTYHQILADLTGPLVVAVIPAVIGYALVWSDRRDHGRTAK